MTKIKIYKLITKIFIPYLCLIYRYIFFTEITNTSRIFKFYNFIIKKSIYIYFFNLYF